MGIAGREGAQERRREGKGGIRLVGNGGRRFRFEKAGQKYINKGKFDSCHHNSVKLGVTLKIMPLNGMDFNMKSN